VNRSLILTRNACNSLFWLFGIGLSLYLAAACFGYVSNSSEHYQFHFRVVKCPTHDNDRRPPLDFAGRDDAVLGAVLAAVISTLALPPPDTSVSMRFILKRHSLFLAGSTSMSGLSFFARSSRSTGFTGAPCSPSSLRGRFCTSSTGT
jgi:hypothetical protein